MDVTRVEQRSYIKIAVLRGRNARDCHRHLVEAVGNNALPYRTVARWVAAFERGREATSDQHRTGRPRSVRSDVSRAVIEQLLETDRRWTLIELEKESGIEKRTIHRILRNDLHLRKIAAKWVPHALTEAQKWVRYATCCDHLARWQQEGDHFLSRIIAIDEFWARAYEPELKRQSAEWRHTGSPRRQKFRQNPSPVKLMVIVAYDIRGVIVCHFVPHGRTVTADYYRSFLMRQVRRGIREKRPDLMDSAIILHDNARPHKADCVGRLLRRWGWEELEHPPYSPDLSPCDFDLIRKVKEPLRGRRFGTRMDITNAVQQQMTRFTHGEENGEADGIRRLPHRWQRVVNVAGDYFEGL